MTERLRRIQFGSSGFVRIGVYGWQPSVLIAKRLRKLTTEVVGDP